MRLWGKREETVDPEAVMARSMAEVRRLGGRTIDHLPSIEQTTARTGEDLAARACVLYARMGLAYEAPTALIRDWLQANGLSGALSFDEAAMLRKETEELTQAEINNAGWGIEAVAALLWTGGIVEDLAIDRLVSMDEMGSFPKIGQGEGPESFSRRVRLRPYAELYAMRDLYYRARWYARDTRLKGEDAGAFSMDSIMERRKALEWQLDAGQEWDHVEMGT